MQLSLIEFEKCWCGVGGCAEFYKMGLERTHRLGDLVISGKSVSF